MTHRGKIVEQVIRGSGYSFTGLAKKLTINRNTLYNRLKLSELDYDFIIQVGKIIGHNFSKNFPELKGRLPDELFLGPTELEHSELWKAEKRYITLLEHYNSMLASLAKLANKNIINEHKKEVLDFIERQQKQ